MRRMVKTLCMATVLLAATTAAWAAVTPYAQDFEGLVQSDTAALENDGWLVFGNVFDSSWNYLYGYGTFPAPNDGAAFCAIVIGEGGASQGAQQLSVYSDYNNPDHGNPDRIIESNVFQEQMIEAGDVGATIDFSFDAKLGNLAGATTALAFIKTLDPNSGFAMTNFITVDMTSIPPTWASYSLQLLIDPSLVGQILQFGFSNTASNGEPSGVFYDNINQPVPVELVSFTIE